MKDYYGDLGIQKGATKDEIKKAYRKMSKQYHPDLNPGNKDAEEKFKKASEAYEVLSDDTKRTQYDQFGRTASGQSNYGGAGGGFSGFSGFQGGGGDFDFGNINDIFESFFGNSYGTHQGSRRRQRQSGSDLETTITISFEESYSGVNKEIKVNKYDECKKCDGEGGHNKTRCPQCNGSGSVTASQQTPLGTIRMQQACPKCQGQGEIFESECQACRGTGRTKESSKVKIKIPAGIEDGSRIRVSSKGEAGFRKAGYGDLYVNIRVSPSKKYQRRGQNLVLEKNIHVLQAILGAEVEIDTPKGSLSLKIPAGTQAGKTFRLKGYGMPQVNNETEFGDLYVNIMPIIPEKLSKSEEKLYKELSEISNLEVKDSKGFFEGFFDF